MSVHPDLCIIYPLRKVSSIQRDSPSRNLLECYNPLPDRNNGMDRMDNTYCATSAGDGRDIRAEKSIRKLDSLWNSGRTLVAIHQMDTNFPNAYTDLIRKQGIPAVSPDNIPGLEK